MNTIYITGASGFIGRNLSEYLSAKSFIVKPLSLREECTAAAIQDADCIIHLAGKAHDLEGMAEPGEYYEVNLELTKKIFTCFLASKARKFIFISSVKAVTDSADGPVSEADIPHPVTHYGKSKLLAEEYIRCQEIPEGKSFYILRPCIIHGPGNKGNLNLLFNIVNRGMPWPLGAFDNRRSFLSIDNLSFVISELAERNDIVPGVYHVADNEVLSTNQLITVIATELKKKPRILAFPKKLIVYFARIGDRFGLPLNMERLKKLTENYVVSNKKLSEALQKPLPYQAEEGIKITIRSFKTMQ